MKGLELSRRYYEEFAAEELRSEFSHIWPLIAVGVCGQGSECSGYDDEVSRDHDFEPGFCIFIPDEDRVSRRDAFLLQRFYDKLPREFEGFRRGLVAPVGGRRRGVIRTREFLTARTGTDVLPLSYEQWLRIPEQSFLEAVNGEIWHDGLGEMTALREYLSEMPEDVRLKKLASYLLIAGQSGQYNYSRCLAHGERGAAALAAGEFAKAAAHALFLLHGRFTPYYKWIFRALREIEPEASERLERIVIGDAAASESSDPAAASEGSNAAALNSSVLRGVSDGPDAAAGTALLIEELSSYIIGLLREQELSDASCGDFEKHAYSVNDRIEDPLLRNADIFEGLNG